MKVCAEQLPIEIWLMIFRYLEAHTLFNGFHDLNNYLNQILASNYLSFYVRLKETDNNHLQSPINPFWSDSVLNRIACLRTSPQSRSSYFLQFLRFHVNKLTRLRSLSINIGSQDTLYTPYICNAFKKLYCLGSLTLTCTPNQNLFESVLAIRTLRTCHLVLRESTTTIDCQFHVDSNIKKLFIIFINNVDNSVINLLLIHMPKLQRLEISGSYFSFAQVSIFDKQLFTLSDLRVLKLKLENAHFVPHCFTCLRSIMPVLKYFYFNYTKHVLPNRFLDFFVSHWWVIIEQFQYINIYIKGNVLIDPLNNNTQNNRQILLAKTSQCNKSFKIQWTEHDSSRFRCTEIIILKS